MFQGKYWKYFKLIINLNWTSSNINSNRLYVLVEKFLKALSTVVTKYYACIILQKEVQKVSY